MLSEQDELTETITSLKKTLPRYAKQFDAILDNLVKGPKRMGSLGGKARAKKLSKKRRSEIARNAANARWGK